MVDNIILDLEKLIEPIVEELSYKLYHIEFVKESGENYLRIYIDKEDGINLEDCEKVSRRISDLLDIEDPIDSSYYLEVSSPGINRLLYNEKHYNSYLGEKVNLKLKKIFEGSKQIEGVLIDFDESIIKVSINGNEKAIPREIILKVSLCGDL